MMLRIIHSNKFNIFVVRFVYQTKMGKYPIIYDLNKLIFIIQLLQALLIMYTIFIITLTTAINNNVVVTKFPFLKNIEDITQKR